MPEIRPFRGIRYNTEIIKDLSSVLSPPYDVISPQEKEAIIKSHPNNIINIELPSDGHNPSDEDSYQKAAAYLREWIRVGVLEAEDKEAIYLCEHTFTWEGRDLNRKELYVRVRLQPWGDGILPHEHTLRGPKIDRLNLMRACNANISPIYSLYPDQDNVIGRLIEEAKREVSRSSEKSVVKAEAWRDSSLTIYSIKDKDLVNKLSSTLSDLTLYIADGHHRYETALSYRDEVRANGAKSIEDVEDARSIGSDGSDYVLMALTAISDPGLVIMPIHRLVKGVESSIINSLKERLAKSFHLEPMPLRKGRAFEDLTNALAHMEKAQKVSPMFLLYGLEKESIFAIQPKNVGQLRDAMPEEWPTSLKELDVCLLHWSIIGPMLSIPPEAVSLGQNLDFIHSAAEAVESVDAGESQLAFIMSPTRVDQVVAVAQSGAKMPQKSTFFYPKLPTGLVINLLD